jgi:hypothetical protein
MKGPTAQAAVASKARKGRQHFGAGLGGHALITARRLSSITPSTSAHSARSASLPPAAPWRERGLLKPALRYTRRRAAASCRAIVHHAVRLTR